MGPGSTVAGRYLVESLAGEGGMGRVYRAVDLRSRATVALKSLADGSHAARIHVEASAVAILDHPHIVRYIDKGSTEDGEPFLVMEWLDGESLDSRLQRAGLTLTETLTLAESIGVALAYIHSHGIIHRDLKPSNIMLGTPDIRSAKIVDFGIARLATGRPVTATGLRVGTLYYMAPEQYSHPRQVDGRVDVFALGCILFECLTGQRAFAADDDMSVFARIVLEQAPRVRELRAEVPPSIDSFIARLLARDRNRRPDAAAVLTQLSALRGELGAAELGPPTSPEASGNDPRVRPTQTELSATELGPAPQFAPSLALSLPRPRGPLIGRLRELEELLGALDSQRDPVTVWGPPGAGKTRLALEVAQRWTASDPARGATFVNLRQADAVEEVAALVANALSRAIQPNATQDQVDLQIVRYLRASGPVLVLLDAAEHLTGRLEPVLERWGQAAVDARFLVTSRARGRDGRVVELGPLPGEGATSPGVRLFCERAGAAGRGLELDPGSTLAIGKIVHALDGNPFAIELAAARLEVLGLPSLLERLARPLELLGHMPGQSGIPPPIRPADVKALTMEETLMWSWSLLSQAEMTALACASVFRGPFAAHAAEAVIGPFVEMRRVLDLLQSLRDKSLLTSNLAASSGEVRLSMSATVREFVGARLEEFGLTDAVRGRHARYFVEKDGPLAASVSLRGNVGALRVLDADAQDLMDAIDHGLRAAPALAASAVLALDPLWLARGPMARHREQLERVLESTLKAEDVEPGVRGRLHQARGRVLTRQGRTAEARVDLEAALAQARRDQDSEAEATAMLDLGVLEHGVRNLEEARTLYRSVAELDLDSPVTEARALGNLGAIHHDEGRFDDAYACYVEAISLFESVSDTRLTGLFMANLAMLDYDRAKIADAVRRFGRAIRLLEDARESRYLGIALGSLGMLELGEGHAETALGLSERAYALLRDADDPRSEALCLGRLAAVLASMGRVEPATLAIAKAERLAKRDPLAHATVQLFRAFLETAHGREAFHDGRWEDAGDYLAKARARVQTAHERPDNGGHALADHSDDARAAVRVVMPLVLDLARALERRPLG